MSSRPTIFGVGICMEMRQDDDDDDDDNNLLIQNGQRGEKDRVELKRKTTKLTETIPSAN